MAEFIVDTTDDSGEGSLRQSILDANSNPGLDTISFDDSFLDINLTNGELEITDDLVIQGRDATISGNRLSRVFNIDNGNDIPDVSVTLEDLTITDGLVSNEGGGIRNRENLIVKNSFVSRNATTGVFSDGAGISSEQGDLDIIESFIIENFALDASGGGINQLSGNLRIENSSVSENFAGGEYPSGGVGSGGGIAFSGDTLTISNSFINRNTVGQDSYGPGGIDFNGSSGLISNSIVSGNQGELNGGGGILNSGDLLKIQNSTVTDNLGDGVSSYDGYDGDTSSTEVVSSIISGNSGFDVNLAGFYVGDGGPKPNLFVSLGNNLIGTGASDYFDAPTDVIIGDSDPGLDLEGIPEPGSLAIDAGSNPDGLTTDIRGFGFVREFNGQADIGAFETQERLDIGLFDAETDNLIATLSDGAEILASEIAGRNLTIAAFVPENSGLSGVLESTRLFLSNGITNLFKLENIEPFALFGDSPRGNLIGGPIPAGESLLTVELYEENNAAGFLGQIDRRFTIVDDLTGLEIELFDTDTDRRLATLIDGTQLQASDLEGLNLTIGAVIPEDSPFFDQVESVRLSLNDGEVTRVENSESYALFGNSGTDFFDGNIPVGSNTIQFDLYSEDNLQGELIDSVSISFSIT